MAVPQDDTDLGGSSTLPSQLADLLDDLLRGGLEPRRRGARVGDGRRGDTLATAVHTTHLESAVVRENWSGTLTEVFLRWT